MYAKAEELQNIAYSSPKKNRVIGSVGHNNTVKWLQDYFAKYSDYYTIELQGVPLYVGDSANFTANGKTIDAYAVTLAPSGHVSGSLVAVPNLGCDAVSSLSKTLSRRSISHQHSPTSMVWTSPAR